MIFTSGRSCLIRRARQSEGIVCWKEEVNPTTSYCRQSRDAMARSSIAGTCRPGSRTPPARSSPNSGSDLQQDFAIILLVVGQPVLAEKVLGKQSLAAEDEAKRVGQPEIVVQADLFGEIEIEVDDVAGDRPAGPRPP